MLKSSGFSPKTIIRDATAALPYLLNRQLDRIIYMTINKTCAALRIQKGMSGPLGPPKIMCSLELHQSSFFHNCKKILMCALAAECLPLMINHLEIKSFCRKVKKESSAARIFGGPKGLPMYLCDLEAAHDLLNTI